MPHRILNPLLAIWPGLLNLLPAWMLLQININLAHGSASALACFTGAVIFAAIDTGKKIIEGSVFLNLVMTLGKILGSFSLGMLLTPGICEFMSITSPSYIIIWYVGSGLLSYIIIYKFLFWIKAKDFSEILKIILKK